MRLTAAALVLFLAIVMSSALAATAPQPPDARAADVALALCLGDLAQQAVFVPNPADAEFRQCAALLEAAHASDPAEPRHLRLLADVSLRLNNPAAALTALEAFRKLRPGDQVGQLEVIDLYVKRMESADKKIAYLTDLIGRDAIPAEVRSILASQCAQILLDSGKDSQAREMIDRALALNPLNLPSLAQKAQFLKDAPPTDRLAVLLAMIRSNPVQGDVIVSAARLVASVGLVEEAINWYALACFMRAPADIQLEFASELLLNGQVARAAAVIDDAIAADPQDYQALALRILVERRAEKPDAPAIDKLKLPARNCLINRLATLRHDLGVADATTRPVNEAALPLPDLAADVQRFKASDKPQIKDAYLKALANLAFFSLYFDSNADEAEKILRHHTQLTSDTDPVVVRLAGWIFLVRDKKDEATVKLSAAAAANDTFAALGLVRASADQTKAAEIARRLLAANPAGPLAALIYDTAAPLAVKVTPSPDAPAVKALLAPFPGSFVNIMSRPQTFYSIRAEPLKTSYTFGQPLLVRITLQNTSEFDLTIGYDGIIKPEVWIDAQLQGVNMQVFPGTCVERLTDVLVLKPRQSITRTVRLDQNALAMYLRQSPVTPVTFSITVRTNVLYPGVSGACGQASTSVKLFERAGLAPSEAAVQKLIASIATGSPDEKIRNLELLALMCYSVVIDKDSPFKNIAPAMSEAIHKAQTDPSSAIHAYACFQHFLASNSDDQAAELQRMLADPAWQTRLLGLVALKTLGPTHAIPLDGRKALFADAAQKAPEPFVRSFAAASLDILARPPATQPTTQPATVPTR